MLRPSILYLACLLALSSCRKDISQKSLQTKHVILVIIDGPRYSETWGAPGQIYIPFQSALALEQGAFNANFRNTGKTWTVAGHTALVTGHYQSIDNGGQELPDAPSIFQEWLKASGEDSTKAWVIASKDKLEVLTNCTAPQWSNKYRPASNCGVNGGGVGSGYRHDSITFPIVLDILEQHHPNLALVNFREPDYSGHQADWQGYLDGIESTDEYVHLLWEWIQNDPQYKDRTTLLVTNDHGRHLDGVSNGFQSHGDECQGCTHISLLALGPDFKDSFTTMIERNQLDVPATISFLLDFPHQGEGEVMWELFR